MKKWILSIVFLLSVLGKGLCGQYHFVTLSTVKARPLAMGGAFVSIKDNLASLDFNPAAFSLSSLPEKVHFSVFFNPLGVFMVAGNWGGASGWKGPWEWLIRGATLSVGRLNFGVLCGEEALSDKERLERTCIFDGAGYEGQKNTSFGFSLVLAPKVSLGMAGEVFTRQENNDKKRKLGYRYGILLKPRNDLNVGLCFVDFPKAYDTDRMTLERLSDETLNIGVSYTPWKALTLALDIRNVSDEGKGAVREPHMGVEVLPYRHVSLRGGYYRQKGGESETLSVGIGLFDWNSVLPKGLRLSYATFGLNMALLWQREKDVERRWFFLSLVLRI